MSLNGDCKNIIVVTQLYYPNNGKDYKIKESIEKLAEKGHNITVITNSLTPCNSENPQIKIITINQDNFNQGSEISYIMHGISFMWHAIHMGSAISGNADYVIATIPTGFAALAAKIIANKKSAKFGIDTKDSWLENAVANQCLTEGSPFHKAAKIVENWLYKNSDSISIDSL